MFSGIVDRVGQIEAAERGSGGMRVRVDTGYTDLALGESVAVNGVCLTVAEPTSDGRALFFISTETLDRTALGRLIEGSRVNLERAVTLSTRLSGHMVQGHVDGLARIARIECAGESRRIAFELPSGLARYCVEKGSIALNGVSLTINEIRENTISLMMIPHTWAHTSFSSLAEGDEVNVEVDCIAKYVERLCQPYLKPSNS